MHPPVKLCVMTQRHIGIIYCLQKNIINKNIKSEETSMTGRRGNATLLPIESKRIWNIISQGDLKDAILNVYPYSDKQRTTHSEFPVITWNCSKTTSDLDESMGMEQWIMLFIIKCIHVHETHNAIRMWMALPKEVSRNRLLNLLKLHSTHSMIESFVARGDRELKAVNQLEC